jgi:hypothetical protein
MFLSLEVTAAFTPSTAKGFGKQVENCQPNSLFPYSPVFHDEFSPQALW